MEITETELKKISRVFRIPEKTLSDFLQEEERKDKLEDIKKRVIASNGQVLEEVRAWQNACQTWNEFEEFFILCEPDLKQEKFFFDWLRSSSYYKEKRDVYLCLRGDPILAHKFITAWIEEANTPEDIQEAISHLSKDDELYTKGVKKIIKTYR